MQPKLPPGITPKGVVSLHRSFFESKRASSGTIGDWHLHGYPPMIAFARGDGKPGVPEVNKPFILATDAGDVFHGVWGPEAQWWQRTPRRIAGTQLGGAYDGGALEGELQPRDQCERLERLGRLGELYVAPLRSPHGFNVLFQNVLEDSSK